MLDCLKPYIHIYSITFSIASVSLCDLILDPDNCVHICARESMSHARVTPTSWISADVEPALQALQHRRIQIPRYPAMEGHMVQYRSRGNEAALTSIIVLVVKSRTPMNTIGERHPAWRELATSVDSRKYVLFKFHLPLPHMARLCTHSRKPRVIALWIGS